VAISAFDVIADSIESRKNYLFGEVNLLKRFQRSINQKTRAVTGTINQFVTSVKSILGQFSNKDSYSDDRVSEVSSAAVEEAWSSRAAVDAFDSAGISISSEEQQETIREALTAVQGGLVNDPSNAFTLARVVYDNLSNLNARRADIINELANKIGLIKLHRDAIPPDYYDKTSLDLLKTAKPELEEVVRKIIIACNSVAAGGSPDNLVRTIENDYEVILRRLGREEVYDASQFSPSEYLSLINEVKELTEELEELDEDIASARENIDNYQSNFLDNFQSQSLECGSLGTARSRTESIIERIEALCDEGTENPDNKAIVNTEEFVLDMAVTLNLIREFVQQKNKFENTLLNDPSPERTSFEASQASLSGVPASSSTLVPEMRDFVLRAERRLVSNVTDPQVDVLYNSVSSQLPVEHANAVAVQQAVNSYEIDTTSPTRALFIRSVEDLENLGLDRVFDALVLGDLTIGFDPNVTTASRVGYAIQQAALAYEAGVTGLSNALGECRISTRYSQARISEMLSEVQSALRIRIFSQLSLKDFVDKRINDLEEKTIKKLCRQLEEIDAIRQFEKCD
jgi:hypothetical protein